MGYGRWGKVRKQSDLLTNKPDLELKVFSNSFLRALSEYISVEDFEVKQFLYNLIDENKEDPFIDANAIDWDQNQLK